MKSFPKSLHVSNKKNLHTLFVDESLLLFRRSIFEHVISNEETSYFEVDNWCRKHLKNDEELMRTLVGIIRKELEALGWKTHLSFGATGLFIYSDERPVNCFDDEMC